MKNQKIKLLPFGRLRNKWMKDPEFKRAYDDLALEFAIIRAILDQRIKKGVTQKQLAEKVGTKQSAIARFESGNYNPTFAFVKKLSSALNLKIKVEA